MAELVHTVGFGNTAWVASLKSKDPAQSYEALRKILNERDIVAFDLGFEGHFAEMTKKLNAKIEDTDPQLKQIEKDIQSQAYTIKGTEVLRLRALSLQESPFRSCMGGDCATGSYFEKALDPNFVYFTLTDKDHKSSGVVTVVLGIATNTDGQTVKTAFVDKIQSVPTDRITAMLEGIRLSLIDKGYTLSLPKDIGGSHNSLSNESLIRSYVAEEVLPRLKKSFNTFTPHEHTYPFENVYSRADKKLDLWKFEAISSKDVEIKAGKIHKPKIVSPSVTVRSLYEPVLSLKNSRREEEQIKFLNMLVVISQIKELGLSENDIRKHLSFVLQDKGFSFQVRKKAFFTWIEFNLQTSEVHLFWPVLPKKTDHFLAHFSDKEITALIGEMSNWKNTVGYKHTFIDRLSYNIRNEEILFTVIRNLDTSWGKIWDINTLLIYAVDKGYKSSVTKLLDKGVDPNARNASEDTVLIIAVAQRYKQIVQILLNKGADIHAQNDFGNTALISAVLSKNYEMVKILLDNGANPNVSNVFGKTPLMLALERGSEHEQIAQALLDKGAKRKHKSHNK